MRKPNVVFVLTDDQGYGDLGCHNNPIIQTPHIDDFYRDSIRLTNFHVGPTCAPTRSGLMTGHYANSTGVWHTIGGRSLLRKNEWTIADGFSEAGYVTGMFGKWHLGDNYPYRPQDRGFQEVVCHGGGGISQLPDWWGNDYFDDTYWHNGVPTPYKGYCTDVFYNEAISFIEENRDKPFFCYIPSNAPHSPYNVEKEYYEPYEGKAPSPRDHFYGMITNIDDNFIRVRNKLKELGLEENTILIFMTDNGSSCGCTLDKDQFVIEGYNDGLRGMKNSAYDGGHRTPFFMRWPEGNLTGGKNIDNVTANIDFMPTLLDLCGVEVPVNRTFHGKSLKPLLYGKNWEERALITDSQRVTNPIKWRQSSVMTDKWRLINGKELYEIQIDREQRHDVSADHTDVVVQLREEYDRWWDIVSEQFEEDIPISLGSDREKRVRLTTHDIKNEIPENNAWNQSQVRTGKACLGYWEIDVEEEGEYLFELHRWPDHMNYLLREGITKQTNISWRKDVILPKEHHNYEGGKALSITGGELFRNGKSLGTGKAGEKSVEIRVSLSKGPCHIEARLSGEEDLLQAPYFTYVSRV